MPDLRNRHTYTHRLNYRPQMWPGASASPNRCVSDKLATGQRLQIRARFNNPEECIEYDNNVAAGAKIREPMQSSVKGCAAGGGAIIAARAWPLSVQSLQPVYLIRQCRSTPFEYKAF